MKVLSERMDEVATHEGVFSCHTIFNCIDACPKELDPTKAIETLRNLATKRLVFEEARRNGVTRSLKKWLSSEER